MTSQLPIRAELLEDQTFADYFKRNPKLVKFAKQLATARSIESIPELKEIFDAIAQEVEASVVFDLKPPEQAVHDAARPLVSKKLIDKLYISAANHGNAIPVIPVGETMRMVDGEHNNVVDRSQFRLVQTPQCFKTEMLLKSFHMVDYQNFTDDSSLYQAAGHQIHLEEGEPFNIKVTHPNDFLFAEYYLQSVERNNLKMHSYKN